MRVRPRSGKECGPMASKITPSLDEAIDYALVHVGNKKTAQLVRACIFSDGIDDQHSLAPQLASALMHAVERQVGAGRDAQAV